MDTPESKKVIERVRLELATRRLMVMLVGMIGVMVGVTIIFAGAPNFIEEWFSPWSRYAIGGLPLTAGLAGVLGTVIGDDTSFGWWMSAFGLAGMAVWYFCMSIAYAALVLQQGVMVVAPGQALPPSITGRGHVPSLYFGLCLMAIVPLITMIRVRRI